MKLVRICMTFGMVMAIFSMAGCECLCPTEEEPCPLTGVEEPCPAPLVCPPAETCPPEAGKVSVSYAYPTGRKETSVVLVEKIAPARIQVGEEFTHHIKVTNLANCDLEDVIVSDRLMENYELKRSTPSAKSMADRDISWTIGRMEPAETRVIELVGMATGEGKLTGCSKVSYRTQLCLSVLAVEPKLNLTKSLPDDVIRCDAIPIRYVITNVGTGAARNVMVSDELPDGLMTQDGRSRILHEIRCLNAGESKEFCVNAKASKPGRYSFIATATAHGGLSAEAPGAIMVREPRLNISISSPSQIFIGRNFTYEIKVRNEGDAAAKDTVVNMKIPSGTSFMSATHNGSHSQNMVSWNLGTLDPGSSKTLRATLKAQRCAKITSVASAKAYCAEQVCSEAMTDLVGIPAVLLEVIDLKDPVEVGGNEIYVITVTNQGSSVDTNIRVTCMLEDTMQYSSSSGPTKATVSGNKIEFAPLKSLGSKAKATWRLNVKAVKSGDVRFKVSVIDDQLTRPVEESEATNFYR